MSAYIHEGHGLRIRFDDGTESRAFGSWQEAEEARLKHEKETSPAWEAAYESRRIIGEGDATCASCHKVFRGQGEYKFGEFWQFDQICEPCTQAEHDAWLNSLSKEAA
jgi:hypothetical protein